MHNIIFIAPHTEVYTIAKEVAEELGLSKMVSVVTSTLTECLNVARQAQRDGADVIIARAWTADLIVSSDIAIPVVYIPIGVQDLAETLYQAREKTGLQDPHTALIGSSQMYGEYATFAEILGMNLVMYHSQSTKNSLEDVVREAVSLGADIVVGGITSTLKAQQLGVPSALLVSGRESVRHALQEAKKIVYARKLEQIEQQKLRAILNASRDGIISVNSHGTITLINSAAMRMLHLRRDVVGNLVEDVFDVPTVSQHIREGKAVQDEMLTISHVDILFSMLPMRIRGENIGSIMILQERSSIAALGKKIQKASDEFKARYSFANILGKSHSICTVIEKAKRYALSDYSVLIIGETGTGKELFAQAIHSASPFSEGPFVAVNCGAFAPSLLESELFGYEAGAFTGATSKGKVGLFEMAHEGTLFLDEISEMDMHGQSRLLRILEERSIMRLGGTKEIKLRLRIIAASNVNLYERVQKGTFRQDLYYRLKVLHLNLPPLRQREGDVELLAENFLKVTGRSNLYLQEQAVHLLCQHTWPGNVRELRYTMESLSMDCQNNQIDSRLVQDVLSPHFPVERMSVENMNQNLYMQETVAYSDGVHVSSEKNSVDFAQEKKSTKSYLSREYLLDVLEKNQWHQGYVAQKLGINRSTLYRQMKKLGIMKKLS